MTENTPEPPPEGRKPEPTILGGLSPLIAAAAAMLAIWGTMTYMKAHPGPDATLETTIAAEDEETFRRAYLAAALRASIGTEEAERTAAGREMKARREAAIKRPGGVEGLDAWTREEIDRLAAPPRP